MIVILIEELSVLRAKIGLSQDDLSSIIGISRQTYSSIETKKRRMSWNTYLSMILVFENNEKMRGLLEAIGAFPEELKKVLNCNINYLGGMIDAKTTYFRHPTHRF